jgi:hypothetical protein
MEGKSLEQRAQEMGKLGGYDLRREAIRMGHISPDIGARLRAHAQPYLTIGDLLRAYGAGECHEERGQSPASVVYPAPEGSDTGYGAHTPQYPAQSIYDMPATGTQLHLHGPDQTTITYGCLYDYNRQVVAEFDGLRSAMAALQAESMGLRKIIPPNGGGEYGTY